MKIRLTAKTMVHIEGNIWNRIAFYEIKPEGDLNVKYETTSHYKSYGLFEEIQWDEYDSQSDEHFSISVFSGVEPVGRRYFRQFKTEEEKETLSRIEEFSKIGTESLYAAINLSEEDKKSLESDASQAQQNLNKEIVDRILKGENISKSELDDILKEFVERSQEIDKLEDK